MLIHQFDMGLTATCHVDYSGRKAFRLGNISINAQQGIFTVDAGSRAVPEWLCLALSVGQLMVLAREGTPMTPSTPGGLSSRSSKGPLHEESSRHVYSQATVLQDEVESSRTSSGLASRFSVKLRLNTASMLPRRRSTASTFLLAAGLQCDRFLDSDFDRFSSRTSSMKSRQTVLTDTGEDTSQTQTAATEEDNDDREVYDVRL